MNGAVWKFNTWLNLCENKMRHDRTATVWFCVKDFVWKKISAYKIEIPE